MKDEATGLPRVVRVTAELRTAVAAARREGRVVGFVPTMGALHAGHVSLAEVCRRECGLAVATVFVNPTQFGPGEDFQRYPRTLAADLELLRPLGIDLVFVPALETMYPRGMATFVDVGEVAQRWEGEHRPGHFRGVATVVLKLLNLVAPDVAYFGQKDYQQTLVVKQLVRDLDLPIEVRVCPTVREGDGLALSSRNAYLSPNQRGQAVVLSRSLQVAQETFQRGERRASEILAAMQDVLATEPGVAVQYAVIADPETLAPVEQIEHCAVALVAAKVGTTRLIDNVLLQEPPIATHPS